jgi:hypothetical protein
MRRGTSGGWDTVTTMNPLPLLAHETWFIHDDGSFDWSFATSALTLTLLGIAVLLTVAVRLIARLWPGIDVPWLAAMAPFMPFAVRMHLAVSLVGLLSLGSYLAPSMPLEKDVVGVVLGAVMVVVAIGMVTGWHARAAAVVPSPQGRSACWSTASGRCSTASTCSASPSAC